MNESLPASQELEPLASWRELESMLAKDLKTFANLTYEEFLDIDEASRIGILYTLEEFGSKITFDEIEESLFEKGILEKYL